MNKKELSEVRKTLKYDICCIDNMRACYVVNGEKSEVHVERFASLPEEVAVKYIEIFKKSISGSIGKQIHCMDFPTDAESEGGGQDLLYKINESGLEDSDAVNALYDKIIDTCGIDGYYCILLMHANYDVIQKGSDEQSMGGDEVYSHIICSICPILLSKPSLSYTPSENKIEDAIRLWLIGMPQNAILFPTFSNRMSDIHSVLFFNKKAAELNEGLISGLLGCQIPASAQEQKTVFASAAESAFPNGLTFDQAYSIQEKIVEKIEEAQSEEDLKLSKETLQDIVEEAGAQNPAAFGESYESSLGSRSSYAGNLADKDKITLKMEGIHITANSNSKDLLRVAMVDGHKCLIIMPNGDVDVNGITAHIV